MRFLEDGREWRLLSLLYADDLVLCSESEEDLRAMVGRFAEVSRKRGLKVNAGKSNVTVLNGEKRLECEVHGDGIRFFILGNLGTFSSRDSNTNGRLRTLCSSSLDFFSLKFPWDIFFRNSAKVNCLPFDVEVELSSTLDFET